ncbi:MAG: hypothetical protein AAGA38_18165 [Pseudomonadota bacterium]
MADRNTHCLELRQKLKAYYTHDFPDDKIVLPIKNQAALARALKVQDATLHNWLQGRNDGREDHLPEKHLNWLTDHLLASTMARLNREQAYDLWRHCTASDFSRQLRNQPSSDIMSILSKQPQSLDVAVGDAPPVEDLQIFEEPFSPLPEEQVLHVGDQVRFEVKTRAGRCLVILASSPASWYWMSPSEQHAGPTAGGTELVPAVRGYGIGDRGPHRVIAIELGCEIPPFVRGRGEPMHLEPHMVQALAEELSNGVGFRWGEALFFAERPEPNNRI